MYSTSTGHQASSRDTPHSDHHATDLGRLPGVFCWTKMGVEAGQDLSSILRRKELERQAGGGDFVWGIGNSIGPTIRDLGWKEPTLPVLFSPIQSKPRVVDSQPSAVILWMSYLDEGGNVVPLPPHTLVTSRADEHANSNQKRHYALFCHSRKSLLDDERCNVDFNELINATSNKGLGFSQVTALVKRVPRTQTAKDCNSKTYKVPFRADLYSPFCVRLADGVRVDASLADEIAEISVVLSPSEWAGYVIKLKERIQPPRPTRPPVRRPLFEELGDDSR